MKLGERYSKGTKFLHWSIALLVIVMLFTFFMDYLPEKDVKFAFMIHKSIGLTILALMMIRLYWIHHKGRPPLPKTIKHWERILARFVQYAFYLLLIVMPLSGWILSVAKNRVPSFFGLFNVPLPGIPLSDPLASFMAEVHEFIAWTLLVLILLHVAGALKHHFIDKDDVLRQMLPKSVQ